MPSQVHRRSHGSKGFVSTLILIAGAGVLALVVPWFSIHSKIGSWSYTPFQNMFAAYVGVLDDIGVGWFLILVVLAIAAYWTRRTTVCIIGLVAMVPTLLVLAILAAACYLVPSLVPQSWVPSKFHHDIPSITGGLGALLSLASSVMLLVWFIVILIHTMRLNHRQRLESGAAFR